ncbi:MAG: DnaJ domain-containing protein, partial [Legionellaceae bacterium]|nr:DnaJ domain-containing protein [Legionellaceae bacterium]
LGIARTSGQTFTLQELKKAYKKLALKTHPDRKNDTQVSFVLVANAYQDILEKIQSENKQQSNLTPKFAANLAKLDKKIDELLAKTREFKREKQESAKRTDNYIRHADDYIRHVDDFCSGVRELQVAVSIFAAQVAEDDAELRTSDDALDHPRIKEEDDEIIKSTEELVKTQIQVAEATKQRLERADMSTQDTSHHRFMKPAKEPANRSGSAEATHSMSLEH